MLEYSKAIVELRKKITAQDAEIKETKYKLGNELSRLEPEKIKGTSLSGNFEKIGELRKVIPEKRGMIREVKKIDDDMGELHQKTNELKGLISDREKLFKSIYENIGNAAYIAFKLDPESLRSYEQVFDDLLKLDAKSEQFNEVDVSNNPDGKNIIRQFMDAAKLMYRNQKHKFMLLRYPGLYRQAGKIVVTTDFAKDAANEAVGKAIKSLSENEKEVKQLNDDLFELENNKAELKKKLISLNVKGKPLKKIQELEDELKGIDATIRECCIDMGNIFLEQNFSGVAGNPQTSEYTRVINDLKQANDECRTEIKRYETLIALEKVDARIVKVSTRIEHIKTQVQRQEQEIKSLQKDLNELDKQKKTYEEVLEQNPPKNIQKTLNSKEE